MNMQSLIPSKSISSSLAGSEMLKISAYVRGTTCDLFNNLATSTFALRDYSRVSACDASLEGQGNPSSIFEGCLSSRGEICARDVGLSNVCFLSVR